jgi:hypothetical protein
LKVPSDKSIFVFGAVCLGVNLWWAIFHDPYSFALSIIGAVGLLGSCIATIILAALERKKPDLYRAAVALVALLLLLPTIRLGGFLQDELFLIRLSRFQEVTDIVLKDQRDKAGSNVFTAGTALPAGYSNLGVKNGALIRSTENNVTVQYMFKDSSAVGHAGYMYRSDDDINALGKEFQSFGFRRLAPHWFYFID